MELFYKYFSLLGQEARDNLEAKSWLSSRMNLIIKFTGIFCFLSHLYVGWSQVDQIMTDSVANSLEDQAIAVVRMVSSAHSLDSISDGAHSTISLDPLTAIESCLSANHVSDPNLCGLEERRHSVGNAKGLVPLLKEVLKSAHVHQRSFSAEESSFDKENRKTDIKFGTSRIKALSDCRVLDSAETFESPEFIEAPRGLDISAGTDPNISPTLLHCNDSMTTLVGTPHPESYSSVDEVFAYVDRRQELPAISEETELTLKKIIIKRAISDQLGTNLHKSELRRTREMEEIDRIGLTTSDENMEDVLLRTRKAIGRASSINSDRCKSQVLLYQTGNADDEASVILDRNLSSSDPAVNEERAESRGDHGPPPVLLTRKVSIQNSDSWKKHFPVGAAHSVFTPSSLQARQNTTRSTTVIDLHANSSATPASMARNVVGSCSKPGSAASLMRRSLRFFSSVRHDFLESPLIHSLAITSVVCEPQLALNQFADDNQRTPSRCVTISYRKKSSRLSLRPGDRSRIEKKRKKGALRRFHLVVFLVLVEMGNRRSFSIFISYLVLFLFIYYCFLSFAFPIIYHEFFHRLLSYLDGINKHFKECSRDPIYRQFEFKTTMTKIISRPAKYGLLLDSILKNEANMFSKGSELTQKASAVCLFVVMCNRSPILVMSGAKPVLLEFKFLAKTDRAKWIKTLEAAIHSAPLKVMKMIPNRLNPKCRSIIYIYIIYYFNCVCLQISCVLLFSDIS
uniref:PH domain-containing protein n=1 Tax=Heterorhabditis bacteriophora TaxID=37862 RepID=A0A1I7WJ68_HETBA